MKKIILGMAALLASALPAMAAEVAYNQAFVNQVVTTTTSFILDMNAYGVDAISFQATLSSANPQAATFNDGHVSSGVITVSNYSGLIVQGSSDTIAVATNSALSPTAGSDSILVSTGANAWSGIAGSSFTIVAQSSVTLVMGVQISTSGNIATTSTGTAILIQNAINTYVPAVTATVSGSSVIVTCNVNGSFCNNFQMNSTTNTLTVASSKFTGGNDNAVITVTGAGYTFLFTQGQQWTQQSLSSNTAISIMNAFNAIPDYFSASTQTTTSVLVTLAKKGKAGNSYTFAASTGALTVISATFVGGQDNATLCIGPTCLVQGTDYTAATSSATTANAISAAINANATLSAIVTSTAPLACGISGSPCGVIYATGTILTSGSNNYPLYTSTGAITLSSSSMTTGTTSAYLLNTATITIPSHGYATGESVGFSTGTSNTGLTGLTWGTSYYVVVLDANNIALVKTSTNAFAGSAGYINLTSSSTTGAHNFTLTPVALTGTEVLSWSQSNDGVNFSTGSVTASNVSIGTTSLVSPYSPLTTGWDFGNINYRYLRLNVAGPSTAGNGGFNTVVTGYGKRYWR